MTDTTAFTVTAERGPALIYASSTGDAITLVDHAVVTDPRERAICRALLVHALALLDDNAAEGAR